jgi:hypothetical protein
MEEEAKQKNEIHEKVKKAYSDKEGNFNDIEHKFATILVESINKDLEAREQNSIVFNGIPYSQSYVYNRKKSINYAAPKLAGANREISLGIVHEKIVAFCAFFLKYVYKRRVKCFDKEGNIMPGMGEIYDLAIEHSYTLEDFKKKIALIYWEVFSQGDAFILDDWQVRTVPQRKPLKEGKEVNGDEMDYTYEFLDDMTYEDAEDIQIRKAVSRLLDGRSVILGNPELEEIQDQPRITIEEVFSHEDAELMFGSLKRWDAVPSEKTEIDAFTGEKITLFDVARLKDPKKEKIVHLVMDKEGNHFNILINGVMMLPYKTPFTLWYPRNNYPLTMVHSERLTGSAYSRSTPAKTKFNADYIDWALTQLANKFEQGVDPALLVKGKYTLTKDLFKGGQRTHGVSKNDYEKADPENKGITSQEFSFVGLIKEIIESQTLNSTTTGEVADQATATGINAAQANQIEKLGYLLDGIVNGFADMAMRRGETIESKYTMKQRETVVDGKKINVYQNFTVSMGGADNSVVFDENVGSETYDNQAKSDELFEKSFNEKKKGINTEYYLANPKALKERWYTFSIDIVPERRKDTYLQIMEYREEFGFLRESFGNALNLEEMKSEYLNVTGRPSKIFLPGDIMELNKLQESAAPEEAQPKGSFGRPKVGEAIKNNAKGK